jgi:hypothetical protein
MSFSYASITAGDRLKSSPAVVKFPDCPYKQYIWDIHEPDNYCSHGQVCQIASSVEEARKLIKARFLVMADFQVKQSAHYDEYFGLKCPEKRKLFDQLFEPIKKEKDNQITDFRGPYGDHKFTNVDFLLTEPTVSSIFSTIISTALDG